MLRNFNNYHKLSLNKLNKFSTLNNLNSNNKHNKHDDVNNHENYPGLKPSNEDDRIAMGGSSADQVGGQANNKVFKTKVHDSPDPGLKDKFKNLLGLSSDYQSKKGKSFSTSTKLFNNNNNNKPLHGADLTGKPKKYSDIEPNTGVHDKAKGGYVQAPNVEETEKLNQSTSAYPQSEPLVFEQYRSVNLNNIKPSGVTPGGSTSR